MNNTPSIDELNAMPAPKTIATFTLDLAQRYDGEYIVQLREDDIDGNGSMANFTGNQDISHIITRLGQFMNRMEQLVWQKDFKPTEPETPAKVTP